MTQPPFGPSDETGSDRPEDRDNNADSSRQPENPYEGITPYPATDHPEDQASFGTTYPPATSAGAASYGAPGPDSHGYSEPWPQPQQHYVAPARVDYMAAVQYGFRATFRNWTVWILGVIALMVVIAVLVGFNTFQMLQGMDPETGEIPEPSLLAQGLISLVSVALTPFMIHASNLNAVQVKITWSEVFRPVSYWRPLIVSLLGGVVSMVMYLVIFAPVAATAAPENFGAVFSALVVAGLVSFLIQPFFMFWAYYSAYPEQTIISALKNSFTAGKQNYGGLLLFIICMGLIVFAGTFITLGLAAVILMPVCMVAQGLVARQAYQKLQTQV